MHRPTFTLGLLFLTFTLCATAQTLSATPSASPIAAAETPSASPLAIPSPTPVVAAPSESASPAPSVAAAVSGATFVDVTSSSGIVQRSENEQFGGPTVADIDGDGNYDLILTYHTFMRIYYGTNAGTFVRSSFFLRTDIHGVAVAQRSARSKEKIMAVATGGGRGTNLRPPFIFLTMDGRSFEDITTDFGFGSAVTRGRVPIFMDMSMQSRRDRRRNRGGPDLLFINLLGNNPNLVHFAYQNIRGNYSLRAVPGFERENEERGIVTDIDNDRKMEVIHYSVFRVFRLIAPFQFADVTSTVAPGLRFLRRSISAVVELDFNNDGFMDLYLARADSSLVTPRGPPSVPDVGDVLLMNNNGVYEDVSIAQNVPQETDSMGVSAEDFNNDGFVDLIITTFGGPDFLLINQGGTGFVRQDLPEVPRPDNGRGHNVLAFDYDQDGRVDFMVAQAFRKAFLGQYHLLRNTMTLTGETNYLHVRVGNEKTRACTSLNAVVTVQVRGQTMVRRVGGRGAQSGGLSYIDTVHFGLGRFTTVRRVSVRWSTGAFQAMRAVAANQRVDFGVDL